MIALDAIYAFGNQNYHSRQRLVGESEKERIAKLCSSGWRARLQMRSAKDEKLLMDYEVEIPDQQITHMLRQCLASRDPHRLSINVIFSNDLRHLVILQSILAIRSVPSGHFGVPNMQCRLQSLKHGDSGSIFNEGKNQNSANWTFAPSGLAFALSYETSPSETMPSQLVKVWSNMAAMQDWPRFEYKGQIRTSGLSSEQIESKPLFAFHPVLPLMVYSEWRSITVWKFNEGQLLSLALRND